MANDEEQVSSGSSDVRSGNMVFEPILDDGVFRFDCSLNDRDAAYPSISFANSKDRETPITGTHKVPTYIPTFECLLEQQVVQLEVSCFFFLLLVSDIRTFDCYIIRLCFVKSKLAYTLVRLK
jgi:hypothetical protein